MNYANSKAKEDKIYEKWGQPLPEVVPHVTEEEREKYRKQALEGHKCDYFQMGNRIICQEGENEHGRIIATNKMLKETKDSVPILIDFPISG